MRSSSTSNISLPFLGMSKHDFDSIDLSAGVVLWVSQICIAFPDVFVHENFLRFCSNLTHSIYKD